MKNLISSFKDLDYLHKEKTIACLDSGGLDSAYLICRLSESYDLTMHVLTVDVGQEDDIPVKIPSHIEKKIIRHSVNAKQEFCRDFVIPLLHAHGVYGKQHPLSASLSRPLIAKHLVELANEYDIFTLLHSATPSQNSMRRFNGAIASLGHKGKWGSPYLKENCSREEKAAYINSVGGSVPASRSFSVDTNIFCREFESGTLVGPHHINPPEELYKWTSHHDATPQQITLEFESGIPTRVNGKAYELVDMINHLNTFVGGYKLGRYQGLEEGPSGVKVLEVREAPAAFILLEALTQMINATFNHATVVVKSQLEQIWVREASEGNWYNPLKKAIDSFNQELVKHVTGAVSFNLSHLECTCIGVQTRTQAYCIDREELERSFMRENPILKVAA